MTSENRESQGDFVAAAPGASRANVANGTFTINHPRFGHFTIKLHTAREGDLAGRRILSLLVGPSNTTDYQGVAFWNDADLTASVWKRHQSGQCANPINAYTYGEHWNAIERKLSIWADLAVRGEKGSRVHEQYTLQHEKRCIVCNRLLTHPDSLETGIGPECAARAAGGR